MEFKAKYITGFNDKGICLNENDLNMLLFLYEHRLLTQRQLFEFYHISVKTYSDKSFYNRLTKFEKEGIIKRTRYDLIRRNGIFMYLVELENKGIDILYLSGYLRKRYSQRIPTSNYEHFLGIKQSVLELYKVILKSDLYGFSIGVNTGKDGTGNVNDFIYVFDKKKANGVTGLYSVNRKEELTIYKNGEFGVNSEQPRKRIENEYSHYKGSAPTSYGHITNYFKDQGYPEDFVTGLYPDWMIAHKSNNIRNTYDIEFDTGSETYETLLKKIVNYMELNKKDERKHTVFIASLDDSITLRGVTNVQTERLSVLKDKIMTGIVDKKNNKNDNNKKVTGDYDFRRDDLEIYVFPLGRSAKIFNKVMNKKRKKGELSEQQKAIQDFLIQNKNKLHLKLIKDKEQQAKHNIYRTDFEVYEIQLLLECTINEEEMVLLPFYLQEGNVRTMDIFCYFGDKIRHGNGFRAGYTKAIGIYQTKDEMLNDILSVEGIHNANSLLFYCLDQQRFYDVLTKEEIELTTPEL
ncbi:replication-relaxation family protein [Virgibacillus halodenitrificans]|uniref:replication-relaxation family protein n=1 Tax=Virgibacillus halodenitrificans TaxID=1482 RepID=UPI000EF52DD5|nr:replication-relaxation family protein [Virgibacillus halodenitrificans]